MSGTTSEGRGAGAVDPVRPLDAAVVVAIFMALGAWLRFHNLGGPSLWSDEGATWLQVKDGLLDVITRTATDTYPPLFNLFAFASTKLLGASEFALRLPAALLGIATIPAVYLLGRMVGGRMTGIIAAAFCALAPFQIFFAQDARAYTLLALTSTLYLAAILRWLGGPDRRHATLLAVASGCALLYSHPYGTFVWFSVLVAAALCVWTGRVGQPIRMLGLVRIQAVIFALFVPWALILANVALRLNVNGFWIARPTLGSVSEGLVELAGGPLGLPLLGLGWMLLLVASLRPRPAAVPRGGKPAWPIVLITAALLPIVVGIAISLVSRPIFVTRYAICVLPAWYVLAASGYARMASRPWLRGALIAFCALATIMEMRVGPQRAFNENWRAMGERIEASIQPGDCVLRAKGRSLYALYFYLPSLDQYCRLTEPEVLAGKAGALATAKQVFLVSDTQKTKRLIKALSSESWRPDPVRRYGSIRLTRLSR